MTYDEKLLLILCGLATLFLLAFFVMEGFIDGGII